MKRLLQRISLWGLAALMLTSSVALADLFTNGKVIFSADRATYLEWDGASTVNLYVAGTKVLHATSSAITFDASVVGSYTTLTATDIDLGASGTAGTVDVFPTTASKGKLRLAATDSTGNGTTTITNADQAAARTYTVPDAGASAGFVMTEGTQTVNGSKTYSGTVAQKTATNVGTVTTGATTVAEEHGDGYDHTTKLTLTAFAIGTSADNAALALGAKFYTFPAGDILVRSATLSGGITCAISVTTDTPEVSIGTVVASGANATMTTGTWENIMDGGATVAGLGDGASVAPDVAGGLFRKTSLSTVVPIIKVSGGLSHDIFLNIAATWADVAAAGACTYTGTVTLKWTVI